MIKKGFTLIELLGVIILLAIVALIATSIVLNVVEEAKISADKSTAYALLDAARLYKSEAMFDEKKQIKVESVNDIYSDVVLLNKPTSGKLYINNEGETALAVIIRNNCYYKELNDQDITIKETNNCDLGWVGNDSIKPTVSQDVIKGTANSNGWYKEDIYIKVNVIDNESGVKGYKRCISNAECEPTENIYNSDVILTNESDNNVVCVIGVDNKLNESQKNCKIYKLDKTAPTIVAINQNITIPQGTNHEVINYFNVTYSISDGDMVCEPINTITLPEGNHQVTCTATGGNGLSVIETVSLVVQKVYTWKQYQVTQVEAAVEYARGTYHQGTANNKFWTFGSRYNIANGKFQVVENWNGSGAYWPSSSSDSFCRGMTIMIGGITDNYDSELQLDGERFVYVTEYQAQRGTDYVFYVDSREYKGEYMYTGTVYKVGTTSQRGTYIQDVTSTNSSAYPNNGQLGSYWYIRQ